MPRRADDAQDVAQDVAQGGAPRAPLPRSPPATTVPAVRSDNPFSRFLLGLVGERGAPDGQPDLAALAAPFVAQWDRFETHVIRVYRAGAAAEEDRMAIAEVQGWMAHRYADYEAELAPFWADRLAGGEPLRADPFRALLAIEPAEAFVDRWDAMQLLPAAREALNAWLLSLDAPEARDG